MGMSSVSKIAKDYFSTLVSQRTGKVNHKTLCAQLLLPLVLGAAIGFVAYSIGPDLESFGAIISGVAVVSALMCAVATMLFQIRIDLRQKIQASQDSFIVDNDLKLVDELFSALLWAILFGFLIVGFCILIELVGLLRCSVNFASAISVAVISAALLHFGLVVGLILKRLNRVYQLVAKNKR